MEKITQDEALALAATLLKVTREELRYEPLENELGYYIWEPIRGGGSLMVANDRSVLFASSSVSTDEHLMAFIDGVRTDVSAF